MLHVSVILCPSSTLCGCRGCMICGAFSAGGDTGLGFSGSLRVILHVDTLVPAVLVTLTSYLPASSGLSS